MELSLTLSVSTVLHPCFNTSKQIGLSEGRKSRVCRRDNRLVPVPKSLLAPSGTPYGNSVVNQVSTAKGALGQDSRVFPASLESGCDPWGVGSLPQS